MSKVLIQDMDNSLLLIRASKHPVPDWDMLRKDQDARACCTLSPGGDHRRSQCSDLEVALMACKIRHRENAQKRLEHPPLYMA